MACRDTETILKELRQIKGTLTLLAAKMGAIQTGINDAEGLKQWSAEQDRIMKNVPVARGPEYITQANLDDVRHRPDPYDA